MKKAVLIMSRNTWLTDMEISLRLLNLLLLRVKEKEQTFTVDIL